MSDITNCLDISPPDDGHLYCNSTVDYFEVCWNYTRANKWAESRCPNIEGFDVTETAKKFCDSNGTWFRNNDGVEWADYYNCIIKTPNILVVYIFYAGYSLSVLCLSISLYIFFFYRQLKCDRITLHKNLFVCHLINALFWIIFYAVISHGDVMLKNPVYCQLLYVIATYFTVGTYFWMFSEGLYLAVVLVVTFNHSSSLLKICIATGWGVPLVLTIIYCVSRYLADNVNGCWTKQSKMQLILAIPSMVALAANLIFLLFILKMLITKLRHPTNREEAQWSKTAKAVFILIPLLGLQNITFLIYPSDKRISAIQDYVTAFLSSFQGVLVSFILCFFNQEVKTVFRRRSCQSTILQQRRSSRRSTLVTEINSNNNNNQRKPSNLLRVTNRPSLISS